MSPELWPAPLARGPLNARVEIPASKSLTNRYLIVAALASTPSTIYSPLYSRDTRLMIRALEQLGARFTELDSASRFGRDLHVTPIPANPGAEAITINAGLAGTVMRFVPFVSALRQGRTTFDGDAQAYARPMGATVHALEQLGARISPAGAQHLPFTLEVDQLKSEAQVSIAASKSSQFVTALLLVGSRLPGGLTVINTSEMLPSPEHVQMTLAVLAEVGVNVDSSTPGQWHVSPAEYPGFQVRVEPDLSNAGPFLAAALVAGGTVQIPGWPEHSTQIGKRWEEILPAFGAAVSWSDSVLTVSSTGDITGADIADSGELAPTVAALAALGSSPSRLSGIAHLRGHETDRLQGLDTELNALGFSVQQTEDGLSFEPVSRERLQGGEFASYHDHRMATTGALLGLAIPGVAVENIDTTAKTMPEFTELWAELVSS